MAGSEADPTAGRGPGAPGRGADGATRAAPDGVPSHRNGELRHRLGRCDLRAVGEARARLREHLVGWEMRGLGDTAELLVSELVTNALVHTRRGAVLTARPTAGPPRRLRVEVRDFAAHPPRARVADERACGGRGLLIVRTLADAWGVCALPVGKTVWFELSAGR